ncbi:glycosyltransferase family 4 protein [Macrococcus bovicus]|uniref:glycosyltransferase family 4 protein n=1 Tax=Macrococcus bovicus TaxID=69968 RepID=UPI0025A67550|nr:glycosyltransferase family 4 protein [Macrococcus bovicus]WJP98486.1 glycosyltransferase family 4 protein [Macrococcus bovicus]
MKILYGITKSDIGGAQTHLIQIINHYSLKHDVAVMVGSHGPLVEMLAKNVKVFIIPSLIGSINIKQDIKTIYKMKKIINEFQPDLIHLHSSKAGTLGRIAAKLSKRKSHKVIFTAHGWAYTEGVDRKKRVLYKLIEKQMCKLSDRIICVSDYDKELAILNGFESSKLVTIHNSVRADRPNITNKNRSLNEVRFVMVARFNHPKNQEAVIRALNILQKNTNKKYSLTFIGDGNKLYECKKLVNKLDVKNVEFTGAIKNVNHILNQYDVFILISKYEGLPISIIEAMEKGLAVIASDVGGISELIDNRNGILIDKNNDINAISQAMSKMLNRKIIENLGLNSKKKYMELFNEEIMFKKLDQVYGI